MKACRAEETRGLCLLLTSSVLATSLPLRPQHPIQAKKNVAFVTSWRNPTGKTAPSKDERPQHLHRAQGQERSKEAKSQPSTEILYPSSGSNGINYGCRQTQQSRCRKHSPAALDSTCFFFLKIPYTTRLNINRLESSSSYFRRIATMNKDLGLDYSAARIVSGSQQFEEN